MMVLMYIGSIQPLGCLLQNRIEMINELMICCSTFLILDFTALDVRSIHALYGWVLNGFLFTIIFTNLVFILYHGSVAIKALILRCWKRVVHRIYLSDII